MPNGTMARVRAVTRGPKRAPVRNRFTVPNSAFGRSMPAFVGLDGYPGGWVAVYLDDQRQLFDYARTAERLLFWPYERAMIDIPIGLPQRGYRDCDRAAKEIIGSSAFLGARWNVWQFREYNDANAYYWKEKDAGISQQLWHLRSKLKEINEAITPEKQNRVQESHPELVFWRLNEGKTLPSKNTPEGRAQRIELLKRQGISRIEQWLGQRHGTGIRRDDLIDACACAIAARDRNKANRLPLGEPPMERGIRMEICY
jgi:predicted RNase H-like nuclease